jgi:hypothetical protein
MNKRQIKSWLDRYFVTNYTINKDLTVDVNGNVDLYSLYMEKFPFEFLEKFPFQFGKVTGHFNCSNNKLTSLINCPYYVGGFFSCSNNKLTSLQHCPRYVGNYFSCTHNPLTSCKELLEIHIGGDIYGFDIITRKTPEYQLLMKLREL